MATYTHFSGGIGGPGDFLPPILSISADEFVIVPLGQTSSTQYVWNVVDNSTGAPLYTIVSYGSFIIDINGHNTGQSTLLTGLERFDPLGNPIDSITGDSVAPAEASSPATTYSMVSQGQTNLLRQQATISCSATEATISFPLAPDLTRFTEVTVTTVWKQYRWLAARKWR